MTSLELQRTQLVPRDLDETFAFFADPRNLEAITPPWLHFRILEDVCNRLTIDDGIHHSSGVAYERVLMEDATKQTKDRLVKAANRLLPTFVEHALWRPKERAWIGNVMRETDIRRLQEDVGDGIRLASSLGLDVSNIELPFAA